MMHVPKIRMSCWTDSATPRPWLWMDRFRIKKHREDAIDDAIFCCAWDRDEADLSRINGESCDGCARLRGEK